MHIDAAFLTLALLVALALAFDFMNGFHDAANSIATVVSTRVLKPYQAVIFAALFNFVAIWLYIAGETTPNRGLPALFYLILLAARLAGIAWIGVQGVLTYRSSVESVDFGPDEPMDDLLEDRVPADRFLPR